MHDLDCFKAYDLRGAVPEALSPELVRAVGRAFVAETGARHVVIGRVARLSGPLLRDALSLGLREAGCEVTDIGMCGTEEIYYAAFSRPFDGGIMITGSHNPANENGLKLVRAGAVPISGDSGLAAIRERTAQELQGPPRDCPPASALAPLHSADYRAYYVSHLLDWVGHFSPAPQQVFVVHGDAEVTELFADTLNQRAIPAHAPLYEEVYDLLENRMLAKGVALESKRTAGGASAASPAFQRLLDVSRELEALISRSRGRPNKDLGKLADQLRQVMAKWE